MRRETIFLLLCASVLFSLIVRQPASASETLAESSPVSPTVQDFHIDNTWAGQSCQFSFYLADDASLDHAIFGCNTTMNFVNDSVTTLSGTAMWANYTHALPSFGCVISFQLWFWGCNSSLPATTGLRHMRVYVYDPSPTAWNSPYVSLIDAIQSVDSANHWANTDAYSQSILGKMSITDLASLIEGYADAQDWPNVLMWSAFCQKLDVVRRDAIVNALGNYTMVGKLPCTIMGSSGQDAFSPENRWGLYGFYWAAQYGVFLSKWNITEAYQQFNNAVYYSVNHPSSRGIYGLPLWIYADGTGETFTDRYYDEDACTVSSYLVFYGLLNVSDALNQALYWWNYTNVLHWNSAYEYFTYTPFGGAASYECAAAFFAKIARSLDYCLPDPDLAEWNRVLTDIVNRFLLNEWNSPQWLDSSTGHTTNVVVHKYQGNTQRRLQDTFGAWEVLLGVYLQLGSIHQNNISHMLCGDGVTHPAWVLLLNPLAGLYDNETHLFGWMVRPPTNLNVDYSATAYAEILLFMMGMVPGTATIAFPVEELNYEYIRDIDCRTFHLNLSARTATVPVSNAGNLTFQYGISPVTCTFAKSGVYQLSFSDSWNIVTNVRCLSALPGNVVYYNKAPLYDVTIAAHCVAQDTDVSVSVMMDGIPTGVTTPYTFTDLTGIHSFMVATNDTHGDPFSRWDTGFTDTTITVNCGGVYRAIYGSPSYDVTIKAHCVDDGTELNVSLALDGSPPTFVTPSTFTDLSGIHAFAVPAADPDGHPFKRWSTGETNTTIVALTDQTYVAYYGTSPLHAVAVTDVSPLKVIVGWNLTMSINVTVIDVGEYSESFNVSVWVNSTFAISQAVSLGSGDTRTVTLTWTTEGFDYGNYIIGAAVDVVQGETDTSDNDQTCPVLIHIGVPGDISGPTSGLLDGICNMRDISVLCSRFSRGPDNSDWDPNLDINDDGVVDMRDISIACLHFAEIE